MLCPSVSSAGRPWTTLAGPDRRRRGGAGGHLDRVQRRHRLLQCAHGLKAAGRRLDCPTPKTSTRWPGSRRPSTWEQTSAEGGPSAGVRHRKRAALGHRTLVEERRPALPELTACDPASRSCSSGPRTCDLLVNEHRPRADRARSDRVAKQPQTPVPRPHRPRRSTPRTVRRDRAPIGSGTWQAPVKRQYRALGLGGVELRGQAAVAVRELGREQRIADCPGKLDPTVGVAQTAARPLQPPEHCGRLAGARQPSRKGRSHRSSGQPRRGRGRLPSGPLLALAAKPTLSSPAITSIAGSRRSLAR